MKYPLEYGYSLVGRVVEVGSALDAAKWIGKRVFAFAPHGTEAVVDVSAAIPVPEGVSAEDATFLPSVETAVSLVQEVCPMLGENVGVVGAGLIGSLVMQVLCLGGYTTAGQVVLFDVNQDRLQQAAQACRDILPQIKDHLGGLYFRDPLSPSSTTIRDLDCCVEVSGVGAGLQTAVDSTRDYGRILLGSWYRGETKIKLGAAFHRSHIELRASQVSDVPAALSGRWDKARRFALAWELLKKIKPSRLLGSGVNTRVPLRTHDVQAAYEAMERGEILTCLLIPPGTTRDEQ